MKRSKAQLLAKLAAEGLHFSEFSLSHEGSYTVMDADWNYKDVPHLHFVHDLVEATIAIVEHDKIVTINMQKALGLTLPLTVCNYQTDPDRQIYFTTWLFFVLVVETVYVGLAENRTRVTTTYSIGAPPILRWCIPIIRWTIKRNYRNLMSTDIPMRERRGQLREWGYRFDRPGDRYGFEQTMDVLRNNVVIPRKTFEPFSVCIQQVLPQDGQYMVGKADHLGLMLRRRDTRLECFPRLCPHEGAELDGKNYCEGKIRCPWHGRVHEPLAIMDLSKAREHASTEFHELTLTAGTLCVAPRQSMDAGS